ncbi:hypothetical protein D3C84_485920 [compost metagenome]
MAVLVGVADAQLPAVFQLDAAGALDLQELQVHRVPQPGQHRRLDALFANGGGVVIGLEEAALQAAAQALALELGVEAVQRDHHHVLRDAVDRHLGLLAAFQAAGVDRFVVAGDQALGAVARGAQAVDVQLGLEIGANGGGVFRHRAGAGAGGGPDRVLGQPCAGRAPGIEPAQQVGVAGGGELFPAGFGVGVDLDRFWLGGFLVATGDQGEQGGDAQRQPAPAE